MHFKIERIITLIYLLAVPFFKINAQQTQLGSFQLLDAKTSQPVPYAHIICQGKLSTMTDYYGYFKLKINGDEYVASSIGYDRLVFNPNQEPNASVRELRIKPSEQILDAVVITPTSLEDMIAEVYGNISNAYVSTPHLIIGELHERYMDTTGHVNITSDAWLQVQKLDYSTQRNRGEVKMDSLAKKYNVKETLYSKIYAGAHIPHRFDFVMRREEFINPSGFHKYHYNYLGEWERNNQKLTVIGFEPKLTGVNKGRFRGEMYIDFDQKVFVKAEYEYTTIGFVIDYKSNWADKRVFISNYEENENGWFLSSTWDEAVRFKDNFLLSQFYETKDVHFDTLTNWAYDEKVHFQEVIEEQKADTVIVENGNVIKPGKTLYERKSEWMNRLEAGYGLKYNAFNDYKLYSLGNTEYNGESFNVIDSFKLKQNYFSVLGTFRYQLTSNFLFFFSSSSSFNEVVKNESLGLGFLYLLDLKTSHPSDIGASIVYAYYKSALIFREQNQIAPVYEKTEQGVQLGIDYEVRLSPRWKLAFGYNYFVPVTEREKYYLQEKYGFLNWFTRKHDLPTDQISWSVNHEAVSSLPRLFKPHSLDVSFILSIQK